MIQSDSLVIDSPRPEEQFEPIRNSDGLVAIKHIRQSEPFVENTPSGTTYIFSCRGNIRLIWAKPLDVNHIRAIRGGCCGQKKEIVFYLANESDVRRWTNNGGS